MADKIKHPKTASHPTGQSNPREDGVTPSHPPDWLEKALQEIYRPVLNEPVPDDILDLLEKLDDEDQSKG